MRDRLANAPLLRAGLLGLAHALLLILAFPPVFVPLVALLIPLPALLATRIEEKPKRAALVFGLATAPAWVFFHRWLIDVTLAGYPILVLVLCLFATLFVLATQRAARVLPWWLAAPLAWTAVEFFRGRIAFDGYPWYLAAQPLAATWFAAPFPTIGVYGSGVLLALTTALIVARRWRVLAIGAPVVVVFLAYGLLNTGYKWRGDIEIAVVQTNVPQDNKTGWTLEQRVADFERFVELTLEAAASDPTPDLIVWPETMFPGYALDLQSLAVLEEADLTYTDGTPFTFFSDRLLALQRDIGIPMLVGAHAFDDLRVSLTSDGVVFDNDGEYNSAIYIEASRPLLRRYDKLHLTPFGEVMPYISWSDWLESKLLSIGAPGMAFNLDTGTNATVFEVDGVRFATPICFEATMSNVCRRLAYEGGERRVDMLIQLTNDGWFGGYAGGRETHLLLARCRAIELGVSVVRAANTGISAVINPNGKLRGRRAARTEGITTGAIEAPLERGTFYGRYLGDSLAWLAFAGTFVAVLLSFRKKKTPESPEAVA